MATLTITIPDAIAPDVYAALSKRASLPASPQNAKAVVIDFIKTVYRHDKGEAAGNTARAAALAQADADAVLT